MTDHLEPDRATREAWARLVTGYIDDWFDTAPTMDAQAGDLDAATLASLVDYLSQLE